MCPTACYYFDHYQGPVQTEPEAFGGFTPVRKVYDFEPVPEGLSLEEQAHVLGAQANLWTEYISTPEHAEYMLLPRLAALSEVVWSPSGHRNWESFASRAARLMERYQGWGWNYKADAFDVV
jgi:hexosaminidase